MQRLFHDQPIPEELRGAVVALGNFDGFHLGHQAVVNRAIALGFHMRRPVIVANLFTRTRFGISSRTFRRSA